MTGFGTPQESPQGDLPVYDCRYCDGRTHDPQKVCADCRYEGAHEPEGRQR